jgi:proprotein convertase subtilisin/kexin type 2
MHDVTKKSTRNALSAILLTFLSACGGSADSGLKSGDLLASKSFSDVLAPYSSTYPSQIPIPTDIPALGARLNRIDCTFVYNYSPPVAPGSGADPLFSALWHLANTGQKPPGANTIAAKVGEDLHAVQAWAVNKGEGVKVAVIDDAIEITHNDLVQNVAPFSSFDYTRTTPSAYPLPCVDDDTHGTSVAGIIAARDNNGTDIAGVSPRVQIAAFNALSTGSSLDIADALNRDQAVTGIYHNSWGSKDNGLLHPADNRTLEAIYRGVRYGRNGKGSIYVFPAGNGGCIYEVDNLCVEENSNFDGYVNNPAVLTICAVDDQGRQPSYGERGANLLVCAPSSNYLNQNAITTLAIQNKTVSDFTGTSASTPMVSGVIALMLSANNNLSWRDVRIILAQTARKNDSTDLGWVTSSGLHFNDKYGFGVVDAFAAVNQAKTWTTVGGSNNLKVCDIGTLTVNIAIPDLQSKSASFNVNCPSISKIEFIEVSFTATHDYSGDLKVELISPISTISELATPRVCPPSLPDPPPVGLAEPKPEPPPCGDYSGWNFGSVRHLNEAASGVWTLKVSDKLAQGSGTWKSWGMKIHGR